MIIKMKLTDLSPTGYDAALQQTKSPRPGAFHTRPGLEASMCNHTSPHASFYPLPSAGNQKSVLIDPSHSLPPSPFTDQLSPGGSQKAMPALAASTCPPPSDLFTQPKLRPGRLFRITTPGPMKGVKKCASHAVTAVNPRRLPIPE